MASSIDGAAKVIILSDDDKKRRRKNPKPRHLSSYGKTTKTPVQTSETEIKSKGKRVCFKTDPDVRQMKVNTSSRETQLVLKEPVLENLPIVNPQIRSDKINVDRQDRPETKAKNPESGSFGFEQCVKLIRQLECSGHVERSFRQKFLTWFSLRATSEEITVVKTFIHSFKDDSVALAEQLVDTFSDCLSKKGSTIGVGNGGGSSGSLCKKPRH